MARKKKQGGITLADVAKGVFMLATAAKLKTRQEVETGLREALPGASVLSVETGTRSKGCKFKIFTIAYRDIQFTYESYQSGNFFFAGKSAMSNDDYCKQLFRHFSREIGEIGEKYGVRIDGGCGISIYNDVAAMEDLDAGVDALGELYALLEDYIPRKKLRWLSCELALWTRYGERQRDSIEQRGDWDPSWTRRRLYLNFKAAVDMGLTGDVALCQERLDAIPQKFIRALYINGEPYVSGRYEIRFLYSLEDGRYYAPVGFGIKISYNGGVEDHLQREIIKAYYPDARYQISMEDQTTTYQIGTDRFQVQRGRDSLTFWKNGRELPIRFYHERSGTHTGAEYFYWVTVEDFAMLMGMSVDRVEPEGVYLRLP